MSCQILIIVVLQENTILVGSLYCEINQKKRREKKKKKELYIGFITTDFLKITVM